LAEQQHVTRVAAERGNVAFDPLECRDLVHQSIVAGGSVLLERLQRQPSERAQAVVDGHDDRPSRRGQEPAIEIVA
jgi:hypothetical protein